MKELLTNTLGRRALPLVAAGAEPEPARAWQGWTALSPLPEPADAPEPNEPQGAYNPEAPEAGLQLPRLAAASHPVELLAPAGGPEAAFAAFHFGADAVYLGLRKFSARA